MIKFALIKETSNNGGMVQYGIRCIYPSGEIIINDITTEKDTAKEIVETFNREQPEMIHIYDIIENHLIDFKGF